MDEQIKKETELFNSVLAQIAVRYNLQVKYPYATTSCHNGYLEIFDSGNRCLGGMNPDGWSLLYNIGRLSEICEKFTV